MYTSGTIATGIVLAVVALIVWYEGIRANRALDSVFGSRDVMDLEAWRALHFPLMTGKREGLLFEIVTEIANSIGVHSTQLYPMDSVMDDYFSRSKISFFYQTDTPFDELLENLSLLIERHTSQSISDEEYRNAVRWTTLEQVVCDLVAFIESKS